MTNPDDGWTLDDMFYELHGPSLPAVRSVEERVSRSIQQSGTRASEALTRSVRGIVTRGSPSPPGDDLIRRCASTGQRRIAMLLEQEAAPPADANYVLAVFLGVTLLEGELNRLLAEPVRPLAGELAEAQLQHKKKYKTEGLRAWGDGKVPATLGLVGQVALGLRWGLEQGRAALVAFLRDRFAPPYPGLVADRAFAQTVDAVRNRFRNPVCHGQRDFFSAQEYQHLARLLTGRDSFGSWRERATNSPAGEALLHHHLRHSHIAQEQATPAIQTGLPAPTGARIDGSLQQRVLDLRLPPDDQWGFEFWVCPRQAVPVQTRSVRAVTRDMGDLPDSTRRFSSGQQMCLGFRTRRPGHVAMADFGTSGKVWALCPSNACRDPYLPVGESFLPPAYDRWPAFVLSGDPGIERVVAIVTAEPLGLDWEPGEPDRPCRQLSDADFSQLLDRVAGMPRDAWSVARCEFELV